MVTVIEYYICRRARQRLHVIEYVDIVKRRVNWWPLFLSGRRSWSGMAGVTVTPGSCLIKRVKQSSQANGEYDATNKYPLDSDISFICSGENMQNCSEWISTWYKCVKQSWVRYNPQNRQFCRPLLTMMSVWLSFCWGIQEHIISILIVNVFNSVNSV